MTLYSSAVEAIGNTPLIRLNRLSDETGCEILGKAEFMNPGQSVKDRAGKQMILEAEARGDLKPGGLIIADEGEFGQRNLDKAKYDANPLEDDSLGKWQLLKLNIS
ncbi:MAG: pyridoxal-phosphate dependent enzyme, partial [Pannonibacter indicus]